MKRVDLVRAIEDLGCEFVRHGGKHDRYRNPSTGASQPVPQHREIKERLAKRIIRMLGTPSDRGSSRSEWPGPSAEDPGPNGGATRPVPSGRGTD